MSSSWKNAPRFDVSFAPSGLAAAIATRPDASTPGVYTADLKRDWCIGFVPHGGYLTTLLLSTSSTHMTTHAPLAALQQPHAIHISVTFLRACVPGAARITLTPVKTGRGYSFIRARLAQGEHARLEAMVVFADLGVPRGPALQVVTAAAAAIPSRVDGCVEWKMPGARHAEVRPAMRKLRYWVPRGTGAEGAKNVREQWVTLADGEKMGLPVLGLLSDMFPPLPENYPELTRTHWYPTLTMSIEIKRLPPPDGWEWLFCRVYSHEIRNGHMDINVDIFDEQSRLVAIARQAAIIVSSDWNKDRGQEETKEKEKGAKL